MWKSSNFGSFINVSKLESTLLTFYIPQNPKDWNLKFFKFMENMEPTSAKIVNRFAKFRPVLKFWNFLEFWNFFRPDAFFFDHLQLTNSERSNGEILTIYKKCLKKYVQKIWEVAVPSEFSGPFETFTFTEKCASNLHSLIKYSSILNCNRFLVRIFAV